MVERGLMLGGLVVPGTDWIIRDPTAWWNSGDFGTRPRPRDVAPTISCGHWTAGEAGTSTADDDGPFVVRVMRNRPSKKIPGAKMQVSITFVIGASGDCWQCMDPLTTVALHVGDSWINTHSVATEVVNVGTAPPMAGRPRPTIAHRMLPTPKLPRGRLVRQRAFYEAQIDTWVELNELLAEHLPIPRQVPAGAGGGLELDRFTRAEARRWAGGMEHYMVPSTTKLDAGTQLMRPLYERAGWALVQP